MLTEQLTIEIDGEQVAAEVAKVFRDIADRVSAVRRERPALEPDDAAAVASAGILLLKLSRMGAGLAGSTKLTPSDLALLAASCARVADHLGFGSREA